jgi:phage terminase large subunit-like protein
MSRALPASLRAAIKSGHVPRFRDWRALPTPQLTQGERVCRFIETQIPVPEGPLVGRAMALLPFQEAFILALFDGEERARKAILSVGRKSGKTALVAALLLAFMFMNALTSRNSRINSAALSREQAALVYEYMAKSIGLSPRLSTFSKVTASGKRIVALNTGIEYHALAAEAGKAMGLSPAVVVGDEWGQVVGPSHPFIDAILTSQGAHDAPLAIVISTQAPSDADWLSLQIDDATRNPQADVVCHLYTADTALPLTSPKAWAQACPAIGEFRSRKDVELLAQQAVRLPEAEASFRKLILNQRVALERRWLAPSIWKACNATPDPAIFRDGRTVGAGLDLSQKHDLTACVLAAQDDGGTVHLWPFVFTPERSLHERELRDRAPYSAWVQSGQLIAVPGATLDYDWLFQFLRMRLDDLEIRIDVCAYDRWRITEARSAADRNNFVVNAWSEVGQGMQSMSPRLEFFETLLLQERLRHGGHPLLNMGAANAVVVQDPAGNRKLDKAQSTQRIDPLVAAVMAAGVFMVSAPAFDVAAFIA